MKLKMALYALLCLSMCHAKRPSPTNYSRRHNKKLTKKTNKQATKRRGQRKTTTILKNIVAIAFVLGVGFTIHKKPWSKLDAWEIELNKDVSDILKDYFPKKNKMYEEYSTSLDNPNVRTDWKKYSKNVEELRERYKKQLQEKYKKKKFDPKVVIKMKKVHERMSKEVIKCEEKRGDKGKKYTEALFDNNLVEGDIETNKTMLQDGINRLNKRLSSTSITDTKYEVIKEIIKRRNNLYKKMSSQEGINELKSQKKTRKEIAKLRREVHDMSDTIFSKSLKKDVLELVLEQARYKLMRKCKRNRLCPLTTTPPYSCDSFIFL